MAHSWEAADGLPPEISALFDDAELLLAIPEHKVSLPGGTTQSQNDVFALIRDGNQTIAAAFEGKVEESFGDPVGVWFKDPSPGKRERMDFLFATLGLTSPAPDDIYYQLLHRTASAIIEAGRFKTDRAAMIVHSFSTNQAWFEEYQRFVALFGVTYEHNLLVETTLPDGMVLGLGWVGINPTLLVD